MPWSQIYTPLGNLLLSALVPALPVVVLLGLLAFWHVRAHLAALAGLASALLVAIVFYGMPVPLALASALRRFRSASTRAGSRSATLATLGRIAAMCMATSLTKS